MQDVERANMVLKKIGEMPYFDPQAIVNVLVNEFAPIRKEAAQQSVQPTHGGHGNSARRRVRKNKSVLPAKSG